MRLSTTPRLMSRAVSLEATCVLVKFSLRIERARTKPAANDESEGPRGLLAIKFALRTIYARLLMSSPISPELTQDNRLHAAFSDQLNVIKRRHLTAVRSRLD